MDRTKRSKRLNSFWLKLAFRFIGFILLYLFLIRPIQSIVVEEVTVPYLQSIISTNTDFIILSEQDDYWIESNSNRFINLFFNLPFNGYFCLASFILFSFREKSAFRFVFFYNAFLFIIHPIFIFTLFSGNYWIAPIISAHEWMYKALFLSLGVLAIKEGEETSKRTENRVR